MTEILMESPDHRVGRLDASTASGESDPNLDPDVRGSGRGSPTRVVEVEDWARVAEVEPFEERAEPVTRVQLSDLLDCAMCVAVDLAGV